MHSLFHSMLSFLLVVAIIRAHGYSGFVGIGVRSFIMLCADPEVPVPLAEYFNRVFVRKQRKVGWDNVLYSKDEFVLCYGDQRGSEYYDSARHFSSFTSFCQYFDLEVVAINDNFVVGLVEPGSSNFGIWVPGYVLLIEVYHLQGRLYDTRLVPPHWTTDVWKHAWRVGHWNNYLFIVDFSQEVMSDPMFRTLSKSQLHRDLWNLLMVIDGKQKIPREIQQNNLFQRLLSVEVESSVHVIESGDSSSAKSP